MLTISVTSIFVVILLAIGATSIMINDSGSKSSLMFSNWPPVQRSIEPKSPSSLRQQILLHYRNTGRLPSNMYVKRYPTSVMRPMKMQSLKKAPIIPAPSYYKPNIQLPPRYRFRSSPSAPNTGEYVFENPFKNFGTQPNKQKVSLTDDTKYNPMHTIPAPNLNKNLAYTTNMKYVQEPLDNQLAEKDQFNQYPYRPLNIPQYQVTEQFSDAALRDALAARQHIYAPDPDQSISNYKYAQTSDLINQQNSIVNKPLPIQISFVPAQAQLSSAPIASPLIQLSNSVPQQQLSDTYALPISNQPQLQQHILQQQSMLQGMPVYNPTYLVTQSNNLLKQHHEHLFKPAPAFLGTINQPSMDMSPADAQPLNDVNSVASVGQVAQSQRVTQQTPLRHDFPVALAQNSNGPIYQRYNIGDKPAPTSMSSIVFGQSNFGNENQQHQHPQPLLTETELSNLLNYGNNQNTNQNNNGFVGSTIFHGSQPDLQVEMENVERQKSNDLTISKANEELKERINAVDDSSKSQTNRKQTAYEEHQQKLNEQFNGKIATSLRIVVPDEGDYEKKNEIRRSDKDIYRKQVQSTSFFDLKDNDDMTENDDAVVAESNDHNLWSDDIPEPTTDTDDYFLNDTESVDRLALDGETRQPISSSTIDSFDF